MVYFHPAFTARTHARHETISRLRGRLPRGELTPPNLRSWARRTRITSFYNRILGHANRNRLIYNRTPGSLPSAQSACRLHRGRDVDRAQEQPWEQPGTQVRALTSKASSKGGCGDGPEYSAGDMWELCGTHDYNFKVGDWMGKTTEGTDLVLIVSLGLWRCVCRYRCCHDDDGMLTTGGVAFTRVLKMYSRHFCFLCMFLVWWSAAIDVCSMCLCCIPQCLIVLADLISIMREVMRECQSTRAHAGS